MANLAVSQPFNRRMNVRNRHEQTPLHTAAESGATEIVRLYIEMGADIMGQDNDGRTPLHLAAKNGHSQQ